MNIKDGDHHLGKLRDDLITSITVTPLDERFRGKVIVFELETGKQLALSPVEADKLKKLLGDKPEGCAVLLEPVDNTKIRISITGK